MSRATRRTRAAAGSDPAFRTKPQLAAALAARGKEAGFSCRAVVADCACSVSDDWYLALREAGLAYVVALKPRNGVWAPVDQPHTPIEAAHALTWRDAGHPRDWTPWSVTPATGTPRPGGPLRPAWADMAPTHPAA
ncbi:transposase [Streptomyces sp. NPDC050625]|uniref:transposase n=1 Tax=Streptomyces sp. NPDC050625 TaxID=3154629 RepID=UPI00342EFAED